MKTEKDKHNDTAQVTPPPATAHRNKWLSVAVILARIVVGAVFIFSGVVKLIDPVGTMYKIEDYLTVLNLAFFKPSALIASCLLSLFEFVLGINVLLGSYLRTTPVLLFIFMVVMTPLTLFLAITNPIPDCGCFGDAVMLTNWETFAKNVLLLTLSIFLLLYNRRSQSVFHREIHALIVSWAVIFAAIVAYVGVVSMPIIDFRPYTLGTDLAAAYYDEDVADAEYDFLYEREGEQCLFTLDSLPDTSEGWQFVERIERTPAAVSPGDDYDYFAIYDGNDDVTGEILDHEGYLFMLFVSDVVTSDDDNVSMIHELYDYCNEYDYPFYAITASSPQEVDSWLDDIGGDYSFLFMDRTTIRTIARNNPFVMILKDGVIYHKLPIASLPGEEILVESFENIEYYGSPGTYSPRNRILSMAVVLFLPILLIYFTERIALFVLRSVRKWIADKKEKAKNNNNTKNQ